MLPYVMVEDIDRTLERARELGGRDRDPAARPRPRRLLRHPARSGGEPRRPVPGPLASAGLMNPIYLDHNATTPLLPEVVDAMLPFLREHFGNPSSTHPYGSRARNAVDRAREQVAAALGVRRRRRSSSPPAAPRRTTSPSAACSRRWSGSGRLVTTTIEHPATARACALAGEPRARGHPPRRRRRRTRPRSTRPGERSTEHRARHGDALEQRDRRAAARRGARRARPRRGRARAHGRRAVRRQGPGPGRRARGGSADRRRPQALRAEGRRRAVRPARHAAARRSSSARATSAASGQAPRTSPSIVGLGVACELATRDLAVDRGADARRCATGSGRRLASGRSRARPERPPRCGSRTR